MGIPNNNKAIIYRQQNDRNNIFYNGNTHTLGINNGIYKNKTFEPIKSKKVVDKNKEMISKIYKKNKV